MKGIFVQVLKLGLASGLILWLVRTGKITKEPFLQLMQHPWLVPFVFGVVFLMILINNYRWQLLLEGQNIETSARQTLPLTFIGLFFNLAMPGSVGGDVIKAYYIAQEQPGTRLRAATSVLMDRIVGLFAMGVIAGTSVVSHWSLMTKTPQLRVLAVFIFCLLGGFIFFFSFGFSNRVRQHDLTDLFFKKMPGGNLFLRIYDAIHSFRKGKPQFVWGIILSILVQSINIICLYILAVTLGYQDMNLAAFFFIIPLGLIATAVPISPAGIGVGQAVFLALFTWYQGTANNLGPTLITIFQVVQACWSLIGAVFYFMRKAPPAELSQRSSAVS